MEENRSDFAPEAVAPPLGHGLISHANESLPLYTGSCNVLHYTPFICCDLTLQRDLAPVTVRHIRLVWEWLMGKMEFASFLILAKRSSPRRNEQREFYEIDFRLGLTLVWFPLRMCFSPPKESAFMSSRQDYDAVETERFNQWEWQYLGCNRA